MPPLNSSEVFSISKDGTSASFSACGAELTQMSHLGQQFIWHGDSAWWDGRAPLLFPVIGRSPGGEIRVGSRKYQMPLHGFVRDREFQLVSRSQDRLLLEQSDDPTTLAAYPFPYRIQVEATVETNRLQLNTTIVNTGTNLMPFCFGYHPGFLWPQEPDPRYEYVCRFEFLEPAPIRRANLTTGLLKRASFDTPVHGRTLNLEDSFFEIDAIMFDAPRSRRVWFGKKGHKGVELHYPQCQNLAIWTKPGAPFLCIEPWQGLPAAEVGEEEISARPGALTLPPGKSINFQLSISVDVPEPSN